MIYIYIGRYTIHIHTWMLWGKKQPPFSRSSAHYGTLLLNSQIHVRPQATVNFPRVVNFETQQQLIEFSVGGFPKQPFKTNYILATK